MPLLKVTAGLFLLQLDHQVIHKERKDENKATSYDSTTDLTLSLYKKQHPRYGSALDKYGTDGIMSLCWLSCNDVYSQN